jgi:hypothetical protein
VIRIWNLLKVIGNHFPFFIAMALALWCLLDDRAELGMGFLIQALLFEVLFLLNDIKRLIQDQGAKDGYSGKEH